MFQDTVRENARKAGPGERERGRVSGEDAAVLSSRVSAGEGRGPKIDACLERRLEEERLGHSGAYWKAPARLLVALAFHRGDG